MKSKNYTAIIKDAILNKKITYGAKQAIKLAKLQKLDKIYYCNECPVKIVNEIKYYCDFASIDLEKIPISNIEFGTICKKPFFVSIVGIKI